MAEQQLDLISKGSGSGGARKGSGRKRERACGSKTIRVPTHYLSAVKALLSGIDSAASEGEKDTVVDVYVSPAVIPYQDDILHVQITISHVTQE